MLRHVLNRSAFCGSFRTCGKRLINSFAVLSLSDILVHTPVDAHAGILHGEADDCVSAAALLHEYAERDAADVCVFYRIGHEIHKNLTDLLRIAEQTAGQHLVDLGIEGQRFLLMFTHLRKEKALISFIIAQSRGKSRQYVHAHHAEDLDTTRAILAEKYPAYLPAFDRVTACSAGHRFNMFVMRKRYFDRWCAFLFDVLFELEQRLDISGYSPYDARVFGFVGERLLDVWLRTNRVRYRDLPYVFMERQNWLTKGGRFVLRKLRGSK